MATNFANSAFTVAIQRHIDDLKMHKRVDYELFSSQGILTASDVANEIQVLTVYDEQQSKNRPRRYLDRVNGFIDKLQDSLAIVDSVIPEIAGLVWGGIRLILQVRMLSPL